MSEQPTMRMVEIEYLEWAGKRMAVFKLLIAVAQAVDGMMEIAEHSMPGTFFITDSRLRRMRLALSALPKWVLEEVINGK